MNKKGPVWTLEENKVFLLVLYRELETALAQCTADNDLYGTGLTENKLFRQTLANLRMDWKDIKRIYYSFKSKETGLKLEST